MNLINKTLLLCLTVTAFFLTACPNELVPFDSAVIVQAKDEIPPTITITYPLDNSAYAKTILLSGIASDLMNSDGKEGKAVSIGYEILGTALSGSVVPSEEDGSFSFLISSSSFTGSNVTINITAEDLNGNETTAAINLIYQNSDIASFSISQGNGSAELSWEIPPETTELRLFNVLSGETQTLDADTDSWTWTGLDNGELVFFQLTAEDSLGNSNVSEIISTMPMSPYTLFPDAYGSVEGVDISWPALTDGGRYVVERAEERDGPYEIKFITTANEVFDASIVEDTAYFYRVYPEGYETIKSDAARIMPLMYRDEGTKAGALSVNLAGNNISGDSAVYTDSGVSYFYYMSDTYLINCVKYDSGGSLSDLGQVIDVEDYAVDSIIFMAADDYNDILFVITGEKGVSVYDLSDPENPVLKNVVPYNFGVSDPYFNHAVIQEDSGSYYLYLVTWGSILQIKYSYSTGGAFSTLGIDTYSLPSSPQQNSSDALFLDTTGEKLYSHYYCSTSGQESEGLRVFDVSTPSDWKTAPITTEISTGSYERCYGITGNSSRIALLKYSSVEIYDSTAGIALVGELAISGTLNSADLFGDYLLISSSSRGVQIVNIDAQNPEVIGQFSTSDLARDVVAVDGRTFVLTNSNTEEFIISFPNSFTYSSIYYGPNWGNPNGTNYQAGVLLDDHLVLARTVSTASLDIWDIGAGSPVIKERIYTPNGSYFAAQGERMIVANTVQNNLTTVSGGEVTITQTGDEVYPFMAYRGEELYCFSNQKMVLFDAPSGTVMSEKATLLLDKGISGKPSFKDDYIYVPMSYGGGLAVVKKNADSQLELASVIGFSEFSSGTVLLLDSIVVGGSLYVLYQDTATSNRMTGMVAFSLSNPAAPVETDRFEFSYFIGGQIEDQYIMKKMEASGHLLFCLSGEAHSTYSAPGRGIRMLDISDPSNITEIGEIDLSPIITEYWDEETIVATSKDFIVDGSNIYFISRYGLFHIEF